MIVLLARQNGLSNIGWVNGNDFEDLTKVDLSEVNMIEVDPSISGEDIEVLDFGNYKLVLKPYENMLGS